MKKPSLALNAFLNGLRSVLNILFPLITFPYVSRKLTVSGIGVYNFSDSIVNYFLLIAGLGINVYAMREGAKYRNNKKEIEKFSSEVFTINIFSTIISYLLLFLCLIIFSKLRNYYMCILIFSLEIFFTTIGTEWIYQIYEDYTYITLRSCLFQIASLILLFIFVKRPQDYLNYAIITVFSVVGPNILNFFHAKKYCRIYLNLHFNYKKHLIPILILFASNIATMIYVNSDITLLGFLKSNYIVGIYSISSKIYQMVKTLVAALLIVTIPRLAMLFGNHKIKEYKKILTKLVNVMVILALPASTGLFMLAKEVILIISGPHFLRSVNSLRILCFATFFSILAWILNDCVLIPAKKEKQLLKNTLISALINVVFNLIFIPILNENSAAISTILAEISMFGLNYLDSGHIVKDIFKSRDFFKNLASSLMGCIGIVVVCFLCDKGWNGIILKTIISVILSVIMYGAILVFLRNKIALQTIKEIKLRMKKRS